MKKKINKSAKCVNITGRPVSVLKALPSMLIYTSNGSRGLCENKMSTRNEYGLKGDSVLVGKEGIYTHELQLRMTYD